MEKFIHVHIPKCGGTSIEKTLEEYNLKLTTYPSGIVIRDHSTYRQLCFGLNNHLDNYTVFSLTRNPYARALSTWHYYNKRLIEIIKQDVEGGLAAQWAKQNLFLRFEDFCEQYYAVVDQTPMIYTHYSHTQFHYLRDNNHTISDKILLFSVEQYKDCILKLSSLSGKDLRMHKENTSKYKNPIVEYFTDRSIQIIKAMFHDDFVYLGYSNHINDILNPPMLKSSI
jgi:hypothetical protein